MTEHGTISHLTLTLSMVKAKLASWILDYDRGITGKLGLQKARLYCSLLMRVRMAFNELSMHRCYFRVQPTTRDLPSRAKYKGRTVPASTHSVMRQDNQSAMFLVNHISVSPRTKHIDLRTKSIQHMVQNGSLKVIRVSSEKNTSDSSIRSLTA
jgi:hypothetical protein